MCSSDLGRLPAHTGELLVNVKGVVDLCAELPSRANTTGYHHVPALDLVMLDKAQLTQAVAAINGALAQGPVLVCCALGYSRSAAAIAAWLLASGKAASVDEALDQVRQANPRIVITPEQRAVLSEFVR